MSQNSISYLDNLYYGASNEIIARAKNLRSRMTPSEKHLWQHINKNQIKGLKFRRQHPIAIFIADFYCHQVKLVIELDGKYHNSTVQKEHDINRTAEFEKLGISVIRFTNEEVLNNINKVIGIIEEQL
ncbi:endonuclease domain-containing protein [Alkalitalea saponilacus]|uniref:Very-short-patch-repair endonuclease n=1 Tax=Alkalitalea saponilacus TaxID=889453 RepID=A0A1T5GZZ9_9BACT|nr:endonuclease domain-containing protein [Alkalitalea saponilacus]ASB50963.1 hypothetical protein CDL62_18325 [Alkalitalea saponilacus]SKC13899.1 Very-short-patch-repair endonuclease [Alkalitalea saponilacus]